MKKILALFVVLDLIFVGVILKISPDESNRRSIANSADEADLTAGQQQKLALIKSLQFIKSDKEIILQTNYLQALCASYSMIRVQFQAVDLAVSGQPPQITHSFSCDLIKQHSATDSLSTDLTEFKSLQHKSDFSHLKASALYSDEEFPKRWKIFAIEVTGEENFTINDAEINQILGADVFTFEP